MSVEQTLNYIVELLEKFEYEKDEDSLSNSFFKAKLNEDWFFHLIEEAKRGANEIAKLKSERDEFAALAELRKDALECFKRWAFDETIPTREAVEQATAALSITPSAALADVQELRRALDAEKVYSSMQFDRIAELEQQIEQLNFRCIDMSDAELNKSYRAGLAERENEVAELTRKLAERQARIAELELLNSITLDERGKLLIAKAREEGRLSAVPEGYKLLPIAATWEMRDAGRGYSDPALCWHEMVKAAPKLEVKP